MISIVCVYNKKEVLDNYLLKSLENQSVEYELILMDNTKNHFKSAAEALNEGGRRANGKYIMFVHQDIDLSSNEWLKETENILNSLENLGIAGVAGRIKYKEGIVTNIENGVPKQQISPYTIKLPLIVQTLDECLFLIPKKVFKSLEFDEETCNDWHLYAVDYCLSIKKMNLNAYVIPSYVYHRSPGDSYSEGFDFTLKKILKKHYKELVIFTTIKDWITFIPFSLQKRRPLVKDKFIQIIAKINQ